ncbi:hypothetical protein ACTFIW_010800 [Dictyostelium discoideum]
MIKQIFIICLIYTSLVRSSQMCTDYFNAPLWFGKDSVESLCYEDQIIMHGKQDCLWDTWAHDKVENGRIQNSVININQQFSVHRDIKDKTSDNILVLYQQYRSSPGGLIVNNVEEHIAFFQTYINVINEIWKISNVLGKPLETVEHGNVEHFSPHSQDCERSKPVDIETDKNYKFNFLDTIHSQSYESKEESTSFKDWSVSATSKKFQNLTTEWFIHQKYPFNSKLDTPRNFYDWLGKACSRSSTEAKYYAKSIPDLSTSTIQGSLISVWSFDRSVDHVVLGTTVKHGMSDWVVGSNIKHNNNYHIKEHNKVSEKVIYLNSKNPFAEFYNHETFTNNITINH